MYSILTEGMKWVPAPHAAGQTREGNEITGVYLEPGENVEWFFITDPKTALPKVIGYAITKVRRKAHLIRVK